MTTKQTTKRRALGDRWIEARSKGTTYRLRIPPGRDRVPASAITRSQLPAAVRTAMLLDGSKVTADNRVEISTSGREGVVLRYVEATASTITRSLEERTAAFLPATATSTRSASSPSTGRLLRGYGAVFGTWTDIADRLGMFRERVARGAFAESLKTRMPILQYDHGGGYAGSLPLGKFTTIKEDQRGLYVEAPLTDSWMVEPVRAALADGSLNGMSFRFVVDADSWTKAKDGVEERTLLSVTLFECGPVHMAAYPTTTVGVS